MSTGTLHRLLKCLLEEFVVGRDDTEEDAAQAEARHDRITARHQTGLRLTTRELRVAQYEAELDKRYGR